MSDPREIAYHGEIDVTPQREEAWRQWKDDYIASCVDQWMGQTEDRDEIRHAAACAYVEISQIDNMPWMPLGEALLTRLDATLDPTRERTESERVAFLLAMRTADTATVAERVAATAYQLGTSIDQARQYAPLIEQRDRGEGGRGRTALYRHFDAGGVLLYVGIAKDPHKRAEQHARHSPWFRFVADTQIEWHDTRDLADEAERAAIESERPVFNQTHNKAGRDAAIGYLFGAIEAVV